jgi:HK97 family phage prohead protease
MKNCFTHVGSDGTFSGYAYVFGEGYEDESIQPGAFAKTIENDDVKMLRNHDVDGVIGVWTKITEDPKGLFVQGQLDLNTELGRETASLMQSGALNGLSLGYITNKAQRQGGKLITSEVQLFEISIVTFPAMKEATVDRKTVTMFDNIVIDDASKPRRTNDGYLVANVRAARTGIQLYRGDEVGRPDMEFVRVYRPPAEVFNKRSLQSYAHRPMTNDHPPEPVNDKNWKKYAVGQTGDEVQLDGDFVRVPMVLMDAGVIEDYESGKRQLSLGYTTTLDFKPGVTKDGQEYDAVQTEIRANHLAVVAAARGGPMLRIGDVNKETDKMKTIMVDGLPVQTDDNGAIIVQRTLDKVLADNKTQSASIADLQKQLADAQTALAAAQGELSQVKATKDAEIDVLKKQVADSAITPAKLDQLVKDRAAVVGKAKLVLGDSFVADALSIAEIRKAVVDKRLGDVAKNYSEDAYAAAFTAITAGLTQPQNDSTVVHTDPLADALRLQVDHGAAPSIDQLYEKRNQELRDAWRKPSGQA